MSPLLAFDVMEGGWRLLVDETNPLLTFEVTGGGGGHYKMR